MMSPKCGKQEKKRIKIDFFTKQKLYSQTQKMNLWSPKWKGGEG